MKVEGKQASAQHKIDVDTAEAKKTAEILNDKKVIIKAKAGSSGKLFGAVTSAQIADEIAAQYGQKVEKKKISLKSEIKNFGEYEAEIKLYTGISAKMKVEVTEA